MLIFGLVPLAHLKWVGHGVLAGRIADVWRLLQRLLHNDGVALRDRAVELIPRVLSLAHVASEGLLG